MGSRVNAAGTEEDRKKGDDTRDSFSRDSACNTMERKQSNKTNRMYASRTYISKKHTSICYVSARTNTLKECSVIPSTSFLFITANAV